MKIGDKQTTPIGAVKRAGGLLQDAIALGRSLIAAFKKGGTSSTAPVPSSVKNIVAKELFALFGAKTATAAPVTGTSPGAWDGNRVYAERLKTDVPSHAELMKRDARSLGGLLEHLDRAADNVDAGLLSQKLHALPPGTVLHGNEPGIASSVPSSVTIGPDLAAPGDNARDVAKRLAVEANKSGKAQAIIMNRQLMLALPSADVDASAAAAVKGWAVSRGDELSRGLRESADDVRAVYEPKRKAADDATEKKWRALTQGDLDKLPKGVVLFASGKRLDALKTPAPVTQPTNELSYARNDVEVAAALAQESKKRGAPCAYLMNNTLMIADASKGSLDDVAKKAADDWGERMRRE